MLKTEQFAITTTIACHSYWLLFVASPAVSLIVTATKMNIKNQRKIICQLRLNPHINFTFHGGHRPGQKTSSNINFKVYPHSQICRHWFSLIHLTQIYKCLRVLRNTLSTLIKDGGCFISHPIPSLCILLGVLYLIILINWLCCSDVLWWIIM